MIIFYLISVALFSIMAIYCDAKNNAYIFRQNDFIVQGKPNGLVEIQKMYWKYWRSLMIAVLGFGAAVCMLFVFEMAKEPETITVMIADLFVVYALMRWSTFDMFLGLIMDGKVDTRGYYFMPFSIRTGLCVVLATFIVGFNLEFYV